MLKTEDQEREDEELAKELDAEPQQTTYPEPGTSTANPSKDNKSMSMDTGSHTSSRWTREQSLFLIETLPTLLEDYERSNRKKHQAYEDMTKLMNEKGHRFTVEQVKNKWLLLTRLYKQNLDLKGKSGEGKITWEYFTVLDEKLGKRRENDPVSTFSSTGSEKKAKTPRKCEDQSEEEDKKETAVIPRKRKSSSALMEYLEAKKTEAREMEKAKQKRHEEKMEVKAAGIKILENILNKL